MKYLSIRGDTILLLYWDPNKGFREHLVVAKLDDPDGTATRYFSGDRGTVGDDHARSRGCHDLHGAAFPVGIPCLTV